ncbi:hypothetical protein [Allorhodopirellula heiligendammensis]|uniref:hypothetical protein n=1 Tax=Allorhodopirellula heiligendammensis TaxID=2714739 RepID=UPI00265E125D|nr:hypothetical protein [Allorhodopirellula heiligendammensis]
MLTRFRLLITFTSITLTAITFTSITIPARWLTVANISLGGRGRYDWGERPHHPSDQ